MPGTSKVSASCRTTRRRQRCINATIQAIGAPSSSDASRQRTAVPAGRAQPFKVIRTGGSFPDPDVEACLDRIEMRRPERVILAQRAVPVL